jgi:peptidoglycan/xylan/chitin deacetylase (PgdA/CDA1 family)
VPEQTVRRVTVVMYHFVRDLAHSKFPDIKGLTIEQFEGQADYVRRHFAPVGTEDVLAALHEPEASLPPKAILLTFDDGYRDHFDNVLPVLIERGMTACFFPPAKAVTEHKVLDVNKIHFVLAAARDKPLLLDFLFSMVADARGEFELGERADYERALAHPNRFDSGEVILIKRLLQRDLPEPLRRRITDALFRRYVTEDEASFSQELYMSIPDLRSMREAGMWIGSHGFDHYWLDSLDELSKEREIDLSLRFLDAVGCDLQRWVMGYPYGAYDEVLLRLLRSKGCAAGFTTEVRIADLDRDDPLTLPRLDTNDLPKRADAPPNDWTARAGAAGPQR